MIGRIFFPVLIILFFFGGFRHIIVAQSEFTLVFVQVPDSGLSELKEGIFTAPYTRGARIVLLPPHAETAVNLTPEFYAACDPDVSFDAASIIFSGKKHAGDFWQIWRMALDGSQKVQITGMNGDCITPVHAGNRFYLDDPEPTPQIIFSSSAHGWKDRKTGEPVFSLYGTDPLGKTIHRLTFNLNDDFGPQVLPNGRIVFSSWQTSWRNEEPDEKFAFMDINNDGTDMMPFYGNHEPPEFKYGIRISRNDQRIYFIESETNDQLGGGALASLSQRRPLHSYRLIHSADEGFYHSPYALPDGRLISSYLERGSAEVYSIHEINSNSGEPMDRIFGESRWHSIDVHMIQERQKVKGRSNWLIPGVKDGVFYCLDSYRTDLKNTTDVERGDIKFVRVIEGLPPRTDSPDLKDRDSSQHNYSAKFTPRRILGMAPVEEDGSFQVRVPAETPVNFQLLDKNYMAVSRQEGWIWVIGNENRGCIGCHEDRELTPPNILVTSVSRPAVDLVKPPAQRRTVDFRYDIGSLVKEQCATDNCHATGNNTLHLSEQSAPFQPGDRYGVYQALVNSPGTNYILPGSALKSPLIKHLVRADRSPGDHLQIMPGQSRMPLVSLSKEDWILLVEWIDLGAWWDLKSELEQGSNEKN